MLQVTLLTTDDHLFSMDFFTIPQDERNSEVECNPTPLSQASPTPITVEIADGLDGLGELSDEEQRDRLFLERKVERAFYEAGKALQEIRDRRLYRSTHKTFEQYCLDRFGFGRHAANRLIAGASVVENLVTIWHQNQSEENLVTIGTQNSLTEDLTTNGSQILPTREAQCRPLTKLEPDQQREVWQQAVEEAGGKVPSSRIVSDIVQRIRERTRLPNPYRVGECDSFSRNILHFNGVT